MVKHNCSGFTDSTEIFELEANSTIIILRAWLLYAFIRPCFDECADTGVIVPTAYMRERMHALRATEAVQTWSYPNCGVRSSRSTSLVLYWMTLSYCTHLESVDIAGLSSWEPACILLHSDYWAAWNLRFQLRPWHLYSRLHTSSRSYLQLDFTMSVCLLEGLGLYWTDVYVHRAPLQESFTWKSEITTLRVLEGSVGVARHLESG